ncbi:MAG TPA: hypothetical protein VH590_05025, partial [Ktedonobacterales bacterium]
MAEHQAPFSAEHIDAELAEREQRLAERLQPASAPADLRLIADLRDLYPPAPDVAQTLERVWHRLEQRRPQAAPRLRSSVPLADEAARLERRRAMHIFNFRREGRPSRVGVLVAVVALLVVVGGLVGGLVLVRPHGPNTSQNLAGGLEMVLQASCSLNGNKCISSEVAQLSRDRTLLEQRIRDGLNLSTARVELQGEDQLLVDLPPIQNEQALAALLVQNGNVLFVGTGAEGLPLDQPVPPGESYPVIATGVDLDPSSIQTTTDPQFGQPVILFQFRGAARSAFADYTRTHVGQYLTVILDNTVLESAVIQSEISGPGQISGGGLTLDKARVLAAIFRSGPLPVPLTVISQKQIGATPTTAPTDETPTPTTPPVSGGGLTSIHMLDTANGWAEGPVIKGWRILHTTDGGSHWQDVTPPGVSALAGELPAYFLDPSVAWVVDQEGTTVFFRTTDGGQTWQRMPLTQSYEVGQLTFIDATRGWMLNTQGATGNEFAQLYRTTNGGASWTLVSSTGMPPDNSNTIPFDGTHKQVSFLNASTGWMAAFSNETSFFWLYVTHDGGVTWKHQTLPLPPGVNDARLDVISPTFFNTRDGILPVQVDIPTGGALNLDVYVTHDGGATWHSTALVEAVDRAVAFIDAAHGWATNGFGLFVTSDGAQHWKHLPPSSDFHNVVSLNFVSITTGWAISEPQDGSLTLLKTT